MFTRWMHTKSLAIAAACALLFSCADASALTVQDILNMAALPEDALITVIENATDLPEMNRTNIDALKKGGIPVKALAALTRRKKALDDASAKPVEPEPAAPAPAVPAPAVPVPAPAEASAAQTPESSHNTGNSDESSASAPDDTTSVVTEAPVFVEIPGAQQVILAPVEGSNLSIIFRQFFKEAYETYSVEAEVAQRYDELQSATAAERASEGELPKVAQWRAQIDTNPVSVLESCINLMDEYHPGMDTSLGAALNQCIGLALRKLGADGMASAYLDAALQSTATIPQFSQTLAVFFEAAHRTDYTSTNPLRIKEHAEEVGDDARQAFLYFVGYSLVYGAQPDIAHAQQILSNISANTIYSARAHILLATVAVRAPEFKFKTAAEHLNTALETLDKLDDPAAYELKNTAWLALARIAYENHAYDAADAFYRKVDINSHHLRDAFLEDAWGQLFAQKYASVLALTHALHAPIFKKSWIPDLKILEAGAYLGLCRYDMAGRAISAMRQTILADAGKLKSYVAQTPARDYYNQVIQTARDPQNSAIPISVYHRVLADQTFKMLHQSIRTLSQEQSRLSQYAGLGFNAWPKLRQIYTQAIEVRQQQMSVILSRIYETTLSELHALDISASQVAIEIRLAQRKREAECLKIVAAGGACKQEDSRESTAELQKRANDNWWQFEGEFWRDELRTYVSGVTSLCE